MNMTYTVDECARLFQWSTGHFRARRPLLEREQNFPKKLPGTDRYSKPIVDDWFKGNGTNPRQRHQSKQP